MNRRGIPSLKTEINENYCFFARVLLTEENETDADHKLRPKIELMQNSGNIDIT